MKECRICNQKKELSEFYKNTTWYRNECKTCFNKKYNTEKKIAYIKKWSREHCKSFEYYRYNSRRRNIEFNLVENDFYAETSKDCSYCGNKTNNGLDRIDNKKGYVYGNICSCCSPCNMLKKELDKNVFLERVLAIARWNAESFCK